MSQTPYNTPRRNVPPKASAWEAVLLFVCLWGLGIGVAAHVSGGTGLPGRDAIIRCGVGLDLVNGISRGRQGFIGCLRWSPLPTLLVLPFLRIAPHSPALAATVVSAGGAALLAALLTVWMAGYGLRAAIRIPLAFAYFVSPSVQRAIISGSSETIFVLLVVGCLCFLLHWMETEELRSLAYLALGLGLAVLARYQAVVLLPPLLLCLAADFLLRHKGEAYCEGTLVTFLVPVLYSVLLWLGANWLIMGEAGFFLRGLPIGDWTLDAWAPLITEGCEWRACVAPSWIAFLTWLAGLLFKRRRSFASGLPAAAACALLLWVPGHAMLPTETADPSLDLRRVLDRIERADESERLVVAGYRGYEIAYFLSPSGRRSMVHTLSFYPEPLHKESRGMRLSLLVPPPNDLHRWEDILLKYPDLYERGADLVFFEQSLGRKGWRVWRMIRTDKSP